MAFALYSLDSEEILTSPYEIGKHSRIRILEGAARAKRVNKGFASKNFLFKRPNNFYGLQWEGTADNYSTWVDSRMLFETGEEAEIVKSIFEMRWYAEVYLRNQDSHAKDKLISINIILSDLEKQFPEKFFKYTGLLTLNS